MSLPRRPLRFVGLVALLVGTLLSALHADVAAHASYVVLAPRNAPSRTPPTINGLCDSGEYFTATSTSILYRSRFSWEPATMFLLADDRNLYVCVRNMPRGNSSVQPFAALYFDRNHNGGAVAERDDIVLMIDEAGTTSAARGNGSGGYVADSTISGWAASTNPTQELTWNAEFQIPLTLIGGGRPGTSVGFHFRHNWLRFTGDDYTWPATGGYNAPSTWGDLLWGFAPTSPGYVEADVSRVTQGLDLDRTAGVFYDLVAGKDTLVRAQLYTRGPIVDVSSAYCEIQRVASYVGGIPRPDYGPVRSVRVRFSPAPRVNAFPSGFFNGSSTFDCWTPGIYVASAGAYDVRMIVTLAGTTTSILNLGTVRFQQTKDMRLLIYPWEFPVGTAGYAAWNSDYDNAAATAIANYGRMHALRSGVGRFDATGTLPQDAGVRYFIHPAVYHCVLQSGETIGHMMGRCDTTVRGDANRALQEYNATMFWRDLRDGRHRDRLDYGMVMVAVPSSGGGQSCWGDQRVAGGTLDRLGDAAHIIGQELDHCLGQVDPVSPNSDPRNSSHSIHYTVPLYENRPMVNMLTRADVDAPHSLMYPTFDLGDDPMTIQEGFEWNQYRQRMLTMPRPAAASRVAVSAAQPQATGIYQFTGMLGRTDIITRTDSGRVDDLPLELTSPAQGSAYTLQFLDDVGGTLSSLPFLVDFHDETAHGHVDVIPLYFAAAVPAATKQVRIMNGTKTLYQEAFSDAAPSVTSVVATPKAGDYFISWNAADPDSKDLLYSIYWKSDPQDPPLLLQGGLRETNYLLQTRALPQTQNGQIIVQASDGFHTGSAESNPITVDAKPPVVTILAPGAKDQLVAGQDITLSGLGYDYTAGPLDPSALSWSSDRDGPLGEGAQLPIKLSAGTHVLTLRATGPQANGKPGLVGKAEVTVTVRSDNDGDGLPDDYESQHICLDSKVVDGIADPDGDRLTSLAEYKHGTDPCVADTDTDGTGDGDEARLGSNPTDPKSIAPAPTLFVSSDDVSLGSCPKPVAATIPVQVAPDTRWQVASDASWLTVTGSGTGNGQITATAVCTDLPAIPFTAHILITTSTGDARVLEATFGVQHPQAVYLPLVMR